MTEISDLIHALRVVEYLANEGRDAAIANRGCVIDVEEVAQFEKIGRCARDILAGYKQEIEKSNEPDASY